MANKYTIAVGNQTCTGMPTGLRLRVPPALAAQYGHPVVLPPVRFAYGQADDVPVPARLGAIGIDSNPTHIDAAEIDRVGNPVGTRTWRVDLAKRSPDQVEAALAEVAADCVLGSGHRETLGA